MAVCYSQIMCGRYIRKGSSESVSKWFKVDPDDLPVFAPSYNVAPQSTQPVVILDRETGKRVIRLMRWGLVPFWAKDATIGKSTINAKAETVATSPAFREAFQRRRCLVPADAFYEWQKLDAKNKQAHAIGLADGAPFAFAGLWDRWKDKATGTRLESFTVITTDPNELMEPLHNRMPVILSPANYQRWLEPADETGPGQHPIDLLRAYPAEAMKAWKVAKAVGNVKNDEPGLCVESM